MARNPPAGVHHGGGVGRTTRESILDEAVTCFAMTGYEGTDGEIGLAAFVKRADELAATYGDRFQPTPWLRDLASSGGSFPA